VFVHDERTVKEVLAMKTRGQSCTEISRATGIPRGTVSHWLSGRVPDFGRSLTFEDVSEFLSGREAAYAYLLGLYLGDGHIAKAGRGVFCLRIFCTSSYPSILGEAEQAITTVLPTNRVSRYAVPAANLVRLQSYSKICPLLIPQHGRGRKHERDIRLTDWQVEITTVRARELIRGLIHSDGSRFVARQRSPKGRIYRYPRYAFDNASRDIVGIFCAHLDLLGIEWTLIEHPAIYTVQVARRASVARLDEFAGPKS
jgi:hypothetical protein